jgi:hypothetical protein
MFFTATKTVGKTKGNPMAKETAQVKRLKTLHEKEWEELRLIADSYKAASIVLLAQRDEARAQVVQATDMLHVAADKVDNLKQQVIDLIHSRDAAIGSRDAAIDDRKEAFARLYCLMGVIYKSHEVTTNIIKESESAQ